jgi:hypothetical protein
MAMAKTKKKKAAVEVSEATQQLVQAQEAVKEEKKTLLEEKIEERLADVKDQSGEEVESITFQTLMDVIAELLKDGKITQADYEPVAQVVEELFEDYVRDFDIPGVPPLLERFVDDALKSVIRPVVRQLFNQFAAA